ncbi:hypothetical protein AMTRI_Chr10g5510 [Amborella trichopoda]|uniref:WAT1-related protein At4g30420 n=1 Tax=Amborella trichopoda TaxID=13333 RepID=UPI0005D32579|nr:WAT1-related protein At4g30420 [Amborella trichopoda]|eukprot:XP_011620938.1 WAT1-related protein At4g30420 [Amborella trichopoda]
MIMEEYLPVMAQLMVQFSLAGLYLMTKVAFTEGMSPLVLVAYRTITATLVLAPLAYFIEKDKRPPLNLRTAGGIFILACLGMAINQNCYFTALYYTSSTFVSTIANLIPAITFVVALLLRLERLDVRGIRGRAKVLGTLTCVGGAMIVTLVKGPSIVILRGLKANFLLVSLMDAIHPSSPQSNWTLGPIFILASVLAWSAWLNYQAWAFKNYPAQLTLTALMCFMAIIPTAGIAFIFEEQSAWTLKWDVRLLTYIYSGVLCTAFQFFIQSWCIKKKGPVFAAAFFPVCTVIVSVLEPIIFHVDVHVGSVVGIIVVICGLYFVLWGKAKDGMIEQKGTANNNVAIRNNPTNGGTCYVHVDLKEPLLD